MKIVKVYNFYSTIKNSKGILLFGVYSFFLLSFSSTSANWRSPFYNSSKIDTLRPLKVGDPVPNLMIKNIINSKTKTANFSDFKGKLVIIDFWATWCTSCIKKIPEIEQIQSRYKDQVQVLMVTREGIDKVQAFLNIRKGRGGAAISLPILLEDKQFSVLFPHQIIPHYAWISPNGELYATTGPDEVNDINIRKALGNQTFSAPSKVDIDATRPLFSSPFLPLEGLQNYSMILKGYYPGLPSGTRYRKVDGITYGIGVSNFKLSDLYFSIAYKLKPKLDKKQLVMPENDPSLEDYYTMEFCVSKNLASQLPSKMLAALNQYSNHFGELREEMRPCLVIKKIGDTKLLISGNETFKNSKDDQQRVIIKKGKMIHLLNRLNEIEAEKKMILDESGVEDNIYIDINMGVSLTQLNEQLKPYGLKVEEANRRISMFYVRKQDVE